MKRISGVGVACVALMVVFAACDSTSPKVDDTSPEAILSQQISDELSDEMWYSEEHQKLLELQKEFVLMVDASLKSGTSDAAFRAAGQESLNGDDRAFLQLLEKGSAKRASAFEAEYRQAVQALVDRYPILLKVKESLPTKECVVDENRFDRFFDRFDEIKEFTLNGPMAQVRLGKGAAEPVCGSYWSQVKTLACSAGCGVATAGFGAAICGWQCWCTFCDENSALADVIC